MDLQNLVKSETCPNCNLDISAGTHKYTFDVFERLSDNGKDYCVKSLNTPIELTVVNKPNGTLAQSVEKCNGLEKPVAVTANYANRYQWQINTNPPDAPADNWQNITGATSANYTIPKDAADGSLYRVELLNSDGYCEAQYSNVMALKVNQCDKVALTLSPVADNLCKGEEVKFTVELTNLGTVPTNVSVTEDIAGMNNFEFLSSETPSKGTFSGNVWTISDFAPGASATLVLKYKAKADVTVGGTEKVYVSKLGDKSWVSYDIQTDDNMKAKSDISAKAITPTPVISGSYDACQTPGTKQLEDFVTSDKTALQWFYDPELVYPVNPAEFDMNDPVKDKKYYVVNTEDGKCVSDKPAEATVTVKDYATEADITADGQTVCKGSTVTLTASTSTVVPNPIFKWYSDATLTSEVHTGSTYNVTTMTDVTYYVSVQNDDYCENVANDGRDVSISLKNPVTSVTLHEKDGDEYDLGGVPTAKRNLGMETEKVLTIDPADASNYTLRWYIGDTEFDGSFPRKPYIDQVYKVVLVDECGNVHIANAGTQVEWPTVFMPYDNSTNKDFVVDIDGGIELLVFDRNGNMVAHTYNGWDGFANQNGNTKIAMPGLYYYKAILPDGSVKKGTVEVFKK